VDAVSAARARAPLVRAARLYEARLLAGHVEEESEEAEAGSILEAETAAEIHEVATIARAWAESTRRPA
jgi:hypothetical protein